MLTPVSRFGARGNAAWFLASLAIACTSSVDDPPLAAAGAPTHVPPDSTTNAGRDPGSAGAETHAGAGGASGSGGTSTGTGAAPSAGSSACATPTRDPGPAPLSLLTREQYLNTLRDLFGSVPDLSAALTSSVTVSAFGAAQGDVSQVELEDYQRAAELVAASVTTGDTLNRVAPCPSGSELRTCARQFVTAFGPRAYRSPLTEVEDVERHLALFDSGAKTSYRLGIELLLRGMLQSPRFLYRVELGESAAIAAGAVALTGHELASRLSYVFWNTLPDAALVDAAERGELATASGVASALTRMLADARGKTAVRRFLHGLLHLQNLTTTVKDAGLFPEWRAESFRGSLNRQAESFFDHVLTNEAGSLSALLTSKTVFVNAELAAYYGVSAGPELAPMEIANGRVSGLLTLPAFLALMAKPDQSSPIYRGKFVREALLCQALPPPPPDIPSAPAVDPTVSTRERALQHQVNPSCSGCHRLLDPIGFGFEHYDALGRYREADGGKPVDARGEILGAGELDGPFDGVVELGGRLAHSQRVRDCLATQWFRYVLSRYEETADACSVERVVTAFRNSDGNLNTLPHAIVETDAFRYRRPIARRADTQDLAP